MTKMPCSYCPRKTEYIVMDHFVPRSAGGKKKGNLIPCCVKCNTRKNRHCFWLVQSVQEYLGQTKRYQVWLRGKIRQAILIPENRKILAEVFDDPDW